MKKPQLQFLWSRKVRDEEVGLEEPSGLSCEGPSGRLWTVSDHAPLLFQLDPEGELLASFEVPVEVGDFEGVVSLAEGKVAVVCEQRSRILVLDPAAGTVVAQGRLSEMAGSDVLPPHLLSEDAGSNGLEGLTFQPQRKAFLAVAERDPRLLIEISADLTAVRSVHPLDPDSGIGADGEDLSGLAWDEHRQKLWIVSDTGERVYLYDPSTGQATSRKLERKGKPVENAEGVTVSPDGQTLYIVTDDGKKSRLIAYAITRPNV